MNKLRSSLPIQNTASWLSIIGLLLLSFVSYYWLVYQTVRTDVYQVFALFGILFLAYGSLYHLVKNHTAFKWVLIGGIAFRILLVFALPNLSDDFYRFNWDGRLLVNGISPFEALPIHFIDGTYTGLIPSNINSSLYEQLNSPQYFTIYPPVCQFVFWFACWLFPNDLYSATVCMKAWMLLFEIGSIYLLYRLLLFFGGEVKKVLLYALNPLVIVELTGNLHFEAAMIFFVLLAVWSLTVGGEQWASSTLITNERKGIVKTLPTVVNFGNSWNGNTLVTNKRELRGKENGSFKNFHFLNGSSLLSAIAMGLAVSSKLIPLIFLPLLIPLIGWWRSFFYGCIVGFVTLLGFLPLFTWDILQNLFSSIGLYFQKFEFNASIYYLVRWLGYQYYGYNIIQTAGKWLALMTLVSILALAFWRGQKTGAGRQESVLGRWLHRFTTRLSKSKSWFTNIASFLQKKLWKGLRFSENFAFQHSFASRREKWNLLIKKCLFALLIYFAFANIVHPWYVCSLVALCVFTPFRFPIIWSIMVILTYYTYLTDAYTENLWFVALEYFVVLGFLIWELYHSLTSVLEKSTEGTPIT